LFTEGVHGVGDRRGRNRSGRGVLELRFNEIKDGGSRFGGLRRVFVLFVGLLFLLRGFEGILLLLKGSFAVFLRFFGEAAPFTLGLRSNMSVSASFSKS
jgi:hypothetical protein